MSLFKSKDDAACEKLFVKIMARIEKLELAVSDSISDQKAIHNQIETLQQTLILIKEMLSDLSDDMCLPKTRWSTAKNRTMCHTATPERGKRYYPRG